MDSFNIGKIILGLQNPELFIKKLKPNDVNKVQSFAPEVNASLNYAKSHQNQALQNMQYINDIGLQLQMNSFANIDRSIFIKNLLGLPQNLWEILMNAQNPKSPLAGGTLGMANINQDLLENQKALAQIFNEEQHETTNIQNTALNVSNNTANIPKDTVALLFSGMVSMPEISKLILQNSKQAVAGLIIAMASASKNGMNNEQLQEMLGVINSCISMAESNNPAQTLKSLMLLYLPWLPLNNGIGFDIEISSEEGENDSNNSKLTVLIQTKNFGNIKGVFTLTTSNSVDILIICSDGFPKKILQKSLAEESSSHAMNTNIDIEEVKNQKEEIKENHETKVNLSATNEMNPYLLLMAHSFIRNTILIDNNTSLNIS